MIPIGDQNRGQRLTPYVNYGLIALNVIVFLYELTLSERGLARFFLCFGVIPNEIASRQDLYTLVTNLFIHGGWLHIGGNMLFLWIFGDNIEDTMGHVKYLIFYLLCGIAANLGQMLVNTNSLTPLVGASGAISSVLAAYLVLFPTGKVKILLLLGWIPFIFFVPAWVEIGLWIVLQFVNGFATLGVKTAETSGGVAYFAHVGGFIAGLILVWIFRDKDAYERQKAARAGVRSWQGQRVGSSRS